LQNGEVIQAEKIEFDDTEEIICIPLEPDSRQYNRAKIKRETQAAIEEYFKRDIR